MIKNLYIFLCFCSLMSCFKDEENTTTTVIKNKPRVIAAESELVINVVDENDKELVGLTASFSKDIKIVNQSSFFHFKGSNVNKFEELLEITDQEGFKYEYTIHSLENEVNYKKINVFTNKKTKAIESSEDNSLAISDEVQLELPKNNFLITNNSKYAGEISARYTEYDLSNPNHANALPGGKFGLQNNEYWLLNKNKAFEINLYSKDKQRLVLQSPLSLEIKDVPSESSLFYYDENSHVWSFVQEVSSNLSVKISKMGTYCVAQKHEFSIIKGQWLINNRPAINSKIELTANNFSDQVFTSNNGKFEVIVPLNEKLILDYPNICSASVIKEVTVSEKQMDLGTQATNDGNIELYQIQGHFKNCENENVESGFLTFDDGSNSKTIFITSSVFKLELPFCKSQSVSLQASSGDTQVKSIIWESLKQNVDLSSIYFCDALQEEYIVMKLGDDTRNYTSFSKNVNSNLIELKYLDDLFLKIQHQNTTGIIENNKANIVWKDLDVNGHGIDLYCPSSTECGFNNIEFTYFQDNSPYIRGRFAGRFWVKTFTPLVAIYKEVQGEFQIKK